MTALVPTGSKAIAATSSGMHRVGTQIADATTRLPPDGDAHAMYDKKDA
jgi:hypothetical protein